MNNELFDKELNDRLQEFNRSINVVLADYANMRLATAEEELVKNEAYESSRARLMIELRILISDRLALGNSWVREQRRCVTLREAIFKMPHVGRCINDLGDPEVTVVCARCQVLERTQ